MASQKKGKASGKVARVYRTAVPSVCLPLGAGAIVNYEVVPKPGRSGRTVLECADLGGIAAHGGDIDEALDNVVAAIQERLVLLGQIRPFNVVIVS